MTCAARATCPAVWRDTRSGSRSEAAAERATARLAGARAAASVRRRARARRPAGVSRARAVDAFRRLRGVGELAKRVWIVCLGYRRFLYELDHPRAPTEAMPLEEALDIADACLNPAAFIEEG
jgi:hypothetical protein